MANDPQKNPAQAARKEELLAALNRAIFMRESQHAARAYEELVALNADQILPGNLQFDLARLLELGNEPRLALHAYEHIIDAQPRHASYMPSLRGAGHLSYRLKNYKKCRNYLELFLKNEPTAAEKHDAEGILIRLPDGKGVPDPKRLSAPHKDHTPDLLVLGLPDPPADINTLPTESDYNDLLAEELERKPNPSQTLATMPPPTAKAPPPSVPPRVPAPKSSDAIALGDDFFGAPPALKLESPQQPPRRTREPSEDFFGPPVGKADDVAPPYERYSETPPLSIGSRDVIRKLPNMATPLPIRPMAQQPPTSESPLPWAAASLDRDQPSSSSPARSKRADGADKAWERLRDRSFAMLLPIGKKIILEEVAEALRAIEGLSDAGAKKAVIERKGILREKIGFDDLVEIYPKIRKSRQKFLFVALSDGIPPATMHAVAKADLLDPGIRMNTNRGVKKARWDQIRLVSCGRLDRQPCVDLYCGDPVQHYRLLQGTGFEFNDIATEGHTDPSDACKDFLKLLTDKCPSAVFSHTVRNLLDGKTFRPQKFESDDEYDRYNLCLLLGHFGEEVNIKELYEASQAASAW